MDELDQVAEPAADLLDRVDSILVRGGAPPGHAVWALLRGLGALPGDAAAAVTALRPTAAADAGASLAPLSSAYGAAGEVVAQRADWTGPAAEAYADTAAATASHLGRLADGVEDTIAYADAVTAWTARSRRRLAHCLAVALGSAQAVAVCTADRRGPPEPRVSAAAADVAASVLRVVTRIGDEAHALREEWAERLAEVTLPPMVASGPATGGTTQVGA